MLCGNTALKVYHNKKAFVKRFSAKIRLVFGFFPFLPPRSPICASVFLFHCRKQHLFIECLTIYNKEKSLFSFLPRAEKCGAPENSARNRRQPQRRAQNARRSDSSQQQQAPTRAQQSRARNARYPGKHQARPAPRRFCGRRSLSADRRQPFFTRIVHALFLTANGRPAIRRRAPRFLRRICVCPRAERHDR